jgi:hypothetical protein
LSRNPLPPANPSPPSFLFAAPFFLLPFFTGVIMSMMLGAGGASEAEACLASRLLIEALTDIFGGPASS